METQSGCEETAAAHTLAVVCSVQRGDTSATSSSPADLERAGMVCADCSWPSEVCKDVEGWERRLV